MTTTTNMNQARRTFQGQWINTLLANFGTETETQQAALAVLWTVLETGYIRKPYLVKTMGYSSDEPMPVSIAKDLAGVIRDVEKLRIPTPDGDLPLLVKSEGEYLYNSDLATWENEIVDAIANSFTSHFPSPVPIEVKEKQYIDGTWVIKHSVHKFKDQSARTAPVAFEALNALNSQGYRINPDMLAITNLVEDQSKPVGGSPIHRLNRIKAISRFCGTFYFKYTFDFRGRIYARSSIITPQGDSFAKACLVLNTKVKLGKGGVQALAIHYANQSGMDKASYKQRIQWAMKDGLQLATQLANARGNWMTIAPLLSEPDNFEQYTAALDWYRAMCLDDPTEYMSNIICHQDATNSGFQFGAALLRDNEAAEYVNITATKTADDKPADLYGRMAENVLKRIKTTNPEWVAVIDRKFCKKPIMVTGYGAGRKVVEEDILVYMEDKGIRLDFDDIKEAFFEALDETVGSMTHITKVMKEHSKKIQESSPVISWITPDGFKVHHQYRDNSLRKVQVNQITALRKRRAGEVDPLSEQMVGALPPNFIHSMDGYMLRRAALSANNYKIAFCPIHDSFGTHASHYWDLHQILKESFVQTMKYPWYTKFCELNGVRESLEYMGDYDVTEAMKAAYMFS